MASKATTKKITEIRTSVITKQIKRTLKTAEYESLVIEEGIEEIIEWSSLSERDQKLDNWDTLLLQRFKKTHDRILDELGLSHKKAYFKNPSETTKEKYKTLKKQSEAPDSVRGLDLDNLDTL